MIPSLLGRKRAVTMILGMHGAPDQDEAMEGAPEEALHAIASELIRAVESKDAPAVAEALRAAWAECEAYEPEEG